MKYIKRLAKLMLFGAILLIVLSGFEVTPDYPTFIYKGNVLPVDELIAMDAAGHYLHCVQQITERTILYDENEIEHCFDTVAEADAYWWSQGEQIKRYNEAYAQRQPPPVVPPEALGTSKIAQTLLLKRLPPHQSCIFVGYWQVFASSFHTTLLATLCNGQSANTTGIGSSSRNVNPNAIEFCHLPNQGGTCHTVAYAETVMIPQPAGNGNSKWARVL